jgi:hypothetical protein
VNRCPRRRNGHACKSKRCPVCGVLWAGDQRVKLFANFDHYDGPVTLGAVTAPGRDVLPYDRSRCQHDPGVRCSGKLGCRVHRRAAKRFNRRAPGNWRRMHQRVSQQVRREHGAALHFLGRTWEFQARGVLHVHPVLGLRTPANRRAAERYLQLLDQVAADYGFGFTERKLESRPGQRAAAYLASYLATGKGGKTAITETVQHSDVPPQVVYVAPMLTRETGVTMRFLRRRRYLHMLLETGRLRIFEGESIDVMTGELIDVSPVRALVARAVQLQT